MFVSPLQYYEWAVGSSADSVDDMLPWTQVPATQLRAASGALALTDLQSFVVTVRAWNTAGAATTVTSLPRQAVAHTVPSVEGVRGVGVAVVGDNTTVSQGSSNASVVFAPVIGGLGVQWDAVTPSDREVALVWQIRRYDTWQLVMESTSVLPAAVLELEDEEGSTVFATTFESGFLTPGTSYAVVFVATAPSGDTTTYLTNRVVLTQSPPEAGKLGTGVEFAEANVEWFGFDNEVGVAWTAFLDAAAHIKHFEVCLVLNSGDINAAPTDEDGSSETASLPALASTASSSTDTNATSTPSQCVNVGISNHYTFTQDQVSAVVGAGHGSAHASVWLAVTATNLAGSSRTVLSRSVQVDFDEPFQSTITVPATTVRAHADFGSLEVTWEPFRVDNAPVVEYFVAVARRDLSSEALPESLFALPVAPQPFRSVGLATSVRFSALWLLVETPYYATVVGVSASGTRTVAVAEPHVLHSKPPALVHAFDVLTLLVTSSGNATNATGSFNGTAATSLELMFGVGSDDGDESCGQYACAVYQEVWDRLLDGGEDLVATYGNSSSPDFVALADSLLTQESQSTIGSALEVGIATAFDEQLDIDFQNATDVYTVAWGVYGDDDLPGTLDADAEEALADAPAPHHFEINIMQRALSLDDYDEPVLAEFVTVDAALRKQTFTGLKLVPGAQYYSVVRAVADDGVYVDQLTDGLTVDVALPCVNDVELSEPDSDAATTSAQAADAGVQSSVTSSNEDGLEGYLFVSTNSSLLLDWVAVLDPYRDAGGVELLCPADIELNASYSNFDTAQGNVTLESLYTPYANQTTDGNVSSLVPDGVNTTFTNTSLTRALEVASSPIVQFTYALQRVGQAFEEATANNTALNISVYNVNSSAWDNTTFNGTDFNETAAVALYNYADPVCCLPTLPALAVSLEPDVVLAEVSSAERGLKLEQGEATESTSQCDGFGGTVALMSDRLMGIGGLELATVVSVQDGLNTPFRWVRNMTNARAKVTEEATALLPRSVCVRVAAHENAVVFAGDDAVQVFQSDVASGTMTQRLWLSADDTLGVSLNLLFQSGTMGTQVAISVLYSDFSGGLVTRLAISGQYQVTGEGFVAIVHIDDGLETTGIDAYIQPRVQLGLPLDPGFGAVVELDGACMLSWGPLTGVVLACEHPEAFIWVRARIPHPLGTPVRGSTAPYLCRLLPLLTTIAMYTSSG